MERKMRFTEGPGPDPALFELYVQFEKLCEIEGPGAADEGDLSRLKQEMMKAWLAGDKVKFIDRLSKALMLRGGNTSLDFLPL